MGFYEGDKWEREKEVFKINNKDLIERVINSPIGEYLEDGLFTHPSTPQSVGIDPAPITVLAHKLATWEVTRKVRIHFIEELELHPRKAITLALMVGRKELRPHEAI